MPIRKPMDVLAMDFAALDSELKGSAHWLSVKAYVDSNPFLRAGTHGSTIVDADTGNFFARQLEYVSQTVRSELFAPKKWRAIVPPSMDQPGAGAESYSWYQESKKGAVKPGNSYSNQAPRVEVGMSGPFTSPIKPLTAMYGYALNEIRAAQQAGMNLAVRKAMAARDIVEYGLNDMVLFGDADLKINGFLTDQAGITIAEVTASAGDKTFAAKIAAGSMVAVYNDLMRMGNKVAEQSVGRIIPTTLLLPQAQFNLVSTTQMSGNTEDTILKRFLANSPYIKEVDWVPELKANSGKVGVGGNKDLMIAYERNPMTVNHICPIDYNELPPEQRGFETLIHVEARCGGTIWERPLGAYIEYGI